MINRIGTGSRNYGRSSSFKIPPVPNMCTKGQCKLSEKDLVKKIVKLAQRDAAAGKDSQHGVNVHGIRMGTPEWKKLRSDYISLSSPNRMELIQNKLAVLANKASSIHSKEDGRFDLFKMLFKSRKKIDPDVGGNFVVFRDEQGNEIARYSEPNGWSMRSTPAESARNTAFYDLWKQALADAQEELESEAKGEFSEFDVTV